ncbi:hypothetical protein APY04_2291 [Hyphomicrobium sulfonivorans]|uniref:Uncharacterized protein n=1 Tax=Hyphomicrobium sulfonivorans TaxID=121290 RepID=A0A120CUW7_HYPSL|nr:hypothetical protein [Hyphomicrobium sulfonivorans]KWT66884.1 hypothetical protein APY04_2291 [Hyphomicrobium sulfonivorans]
MLPKAQPLAQSLYLIRRAYAWHARNALTALVITLGAVFAAVSANATPQQAPNSRVVLDLPEEYAPSPLFAGFQNERSGVTYVILEAPAKEYDKMAQGFTTQELLKRGITDVTSGNLARSGPHVYMRAQQKSEAGNYAKFFVLFRTDDQTVLVSVNVPQRSLDNGSIKPAEIEQVLATAKTTEKPAVRDLYALSYLGPFKEAGRVVGTSKLYTLDGRLEPERVGETRTAFMVAPSLDKRVLQEPAKQSVAQLGSLPGFADFKPGKPTPVTIGGLSGFELTASATDADNGRPIQLYQALLLGPDGGYYRLIGIATPKDADVAGEEFPKIARSFELLP